MKKLYYAPNPKLVDPSVLFTQACIARTHFSAGAFGIVKGDSVFTRYFGRHSSLPGDPVVSTHENSLFDVASVTKSLPVALLVFWAVHEGLLTLETPIRQFFPGLQPTDSTEPTVLDLLTYRMRLHRDELKKPYKFAPGEALHKIITSHVTVGGELHYGNYQPILLAQILEEVTGMSLVDLTQKVLFAPLWVNATFNPPQYIDKVVATEIGDSGRPLYGIVHDELTRNNDLLGAAGLFATCTDLLRLLRFILNKGAIGSQQIIAERFFDLMGQNQFQTGLEFGVGFGIWPEFASGYDPMTRVMESIHPRYSAGAIFKNGFTGVQVAAFPVLDTAVVSLTNYVHPKRTGNSQWINRFRYAVAMSLLSGECPSDAKLLWNKPAKIK